MVQQVRLLSKILITVCLVAFISCREQAVKKNIPQVYMNAEKGHWKEVGPLLYHNGFLFSGSKFKLYPDGDTAFLFTYLDGKQEGIQYQWYPGKQLKEKRSFINGWQEGVQEGWHSSGKTAFIYHFENDVYDGNLKQWYADGRLYRDCNYAKGQESGRQLFLNTDGSIKANYEVRNGKIYGNTGTKNCASPWKAR